MLFEPDGSDIKVRALAYHSYITGGFKTDFVHVTAKILYGRSLLQKTAVSKSIQTTLS